MTRANISTRILSNEHRSNFDCGNDSLNRYFRQQISQDARREFASAVVAVEDGTEEVAGYYVASPAGISLDETYQEWTAKFPRYPVVSAAKIGRLAVARQFQRRGVGTALMIDAANRLYKTLDIFKGENAVC